MCTYRSQLSLLVLMAAHVYVQISVHHQAALLVSPPNGRISRSTTKAALLRTMEHICLDHLSDVDGDVVLLLVQFSVDEMTRSPDYLPVVQMPASGILVALGKAHCNEVMEGLLKHLQPGVVPHYSILHTMGSLAAANVFGIVPFVKATLGTLLPMMGGLRSDALRQVFSYTLGKFSEAVADYLVNIDHAPDPTVKLGAFSTEMGIAYDVLASSWLQSRDPKVPPTPCCSSDTVQGPQGTTSPCCSSDIVQGPQGTTSPCCSSDTVSGRAERNQLFLMFFDSLLY
uniref:(California timema) hypothetical protein n=1 Tax=Timema californicum TaxID=61474 RepID=A0A7R9JHV2_TIMCA|nr:unnamed protein product [Timema californicum]